MSVDGTGFGFATIYNEDQDIQYLDQVIQGTPNQVIVTQQPTYIQLSTPQDIATSSNVTFAVVNTPQLNATDASITTGTIGTLDSTNGNITNLSATSANITTATIPTLSATNANITTATIPTLSATNANITTGTVGTLDSTNGNITNLSATSANITTATIPTLSATNANITTGTVGTLDSTTANLANLNSTNSSLGSATCSSLNIAGLSGPNILSIDSKNNVTTADITIDNAVLGGNASGIVGGVVLATTNANGMNGTLSYNGSTRTLTQANSATQNLDTTGSPSFQNLHVSGGSTSYLDVTTGASGGNNGIILTDSNQTGAFLNYSGLGSPGNTGFAVACGSYPSAHTSSQNTSGIAFGYNFYDSYIYTKTNDSVRGTTYFQDGTGSSIMTANKNSLTVPVTLISPIANINDSNNNTQIGSGIPGTSLSGTACSIYGYQAGAANTSGIGNSYFGYKAGNSVVTAGNCTFMGAAAGQNVTGGQNTAFGAGAMINGSGNDNTAVGEACLNALTTGSENTVVGYIAGQTPTTGTQNIIIGSKANVSSTSSTNRIMIGYNGTNSNDNTTIIGNSSNTDISSLGTCTLGGNNTFSTIHSSGINFGGNTLGAYSVGTWTPTLKCGTTSATLSGQAGSYINIGGIVSLGGSFTISNLNSGSGNAVISGLPFSAGSSLWIGPLSGSVGIGSNMIVRVSGSTLEMQYSTTGGGGYNNMTNTNLAATYVILFSLVYSTVN